jgi:hypothetical protein
MDTVGPTTGRSTRLQAEGASRETRKGLEADVSIGNHPWTVKDLKQWKTDCGWTPKETPRGVSARRKHHALQNPEFLDDSAIEEPHAEESHANDDDDLDVDEYQAGPAPPH